jgi:hypothetical protein
MLFVFALADLTDSSDPLVILIAFSTGMTAARSLSGAVRAFAVTVCGIALYFKCAHAAAKLASTPYLGAFSYRGLISGKASR